MFSSMTSELQRISDCPLYIDPRVSYRSHIFCNDCEEKTRVERTPCPLCQQFPAIPDDGHNGISRNCFLGNLMDIHQLYVENKLKITGEKRFGKNLS